MKKPVKKQVQVGPQAAVSRMLNDMMLRVSPPSAPEAELGILGCMLEDNALLDLPHKEQWFHHELNRSVYQQMVSMRKGGMIVEFVALSKILYQKGVFHEEGAATAFVLGLEEGTNYSRQMYQQYLDILIVCELGRATINGGVAMIASGYSHDVLTIEESAISQLNIITESARGINGHEVSWEDEVSSFEKEWTRRYKGEERSAIKSAWPEWDSVFGGILPQYHILKGKTSQGKTSLGLNILKTVAIDRKEPCLWFPYEMQKDTLIKRLIADIASIDSRVLFAPDVFRPSDDERKKITRAMGILLDAKIKLVKQRHMDVDFISRQCLSFAQEHNRIGLVGIDYLQKIAHPEWVGRNDNSSDRIAYNSDQCFQLQQELKCAMVVISSTNQEGGTLGSQSGDYDTDIAIEVSREKGITVKKNRHGRVPESPIPLHFNPQSVRFESETHDHDNLP